MSTSNKKHEEGWLQMWSSKYAEQDDSYAKVFEQLLKDPGVDVNSLIGSDTTPLHLACVLKSTSSALLLIKSPECDLSLKDSWGLTALHRLLYETKGTCFTLCTIVKEMIQHATFPDCATVLTHVGHSALDFFLKSPDINSPLLQMCPAGRELLDLLLSCDTLVHASKSTLAVAISFSSYEACEKLLLKSVCVDSYINNCEYALHRVIQQNSLRKCRLLMKYKPNLNIKWMGLRPLPLAIANGCCVEILELLSRGKSDQEIFSSVEKVSAVGENVEGSMTRLNVPTWISIMSVRAGENDSQTQVKVDSKQCYVTRKCNVDQENIEKHWSNFAKECTTTIPYDKANRSERIYDDASLATICLTRTYIESFKAEVTLVRESVLQFTEDIALRVSQSTKSFLAFKNILAGSTAEGSKCFSPNEVDIICAFSKIEHLQIIADGFHVKIMPGTSASWQSFCTVDGYIDPRKVAQAFYDIIHITVMSIAAQEKRYGNLHLFKYSLQMMDKISRLKLLWRGNVFQSMIVHVDLVPAFLCPQYRPIVSLPLGLESSEFYAVAKASRHYYGPLVRFPVSYCRAEKEALHKVPEYVKQGYIISKALRIASVCGQDINKDDLHIDENIQIDDFISSYVLKTCLLNLLKKRTDKLDNLEQEKEQCKFKWADMIYEELETSLQLRVISSWYDPSGVHRLLDCTQCEEGLTCCFKRSIMLKLTQNVRAWLRQNGKYLQQEPVIL